MPTPPTPDDAQNVIFLIRWWQEILSGLIIILTGWFLKTKGSREESPISPLTDEAIERRLTICKQAILIALHQELDKRDAKLFKHIEKRDEKMVDHMKDIINGSIR